MKVDALLCVCLLIGSSFNLKISSSTSQVYDNDGHYPSVYFKTGYLDIPYEVHPKVEEEQFYNDVVNAPIKTNYCEKKDFDLGSYSNQAVCKTATSKTAEHIAFYIKIRFCSVSNLVWYFRFGLDFTHGGAVYLDGNLFSFYGGDMWWAGNWNAYTNLNGAAMVFDTPGYHILEIVGHEKCCDGNQQIQYSHDHVTWKNVNSANLASECNNMPNCPSKDNGSSTTTTTTQ